MSMIYLTFNSELRQYPEGDPAIDTLTRKGWTITTPPTFDAETHSCAWVDSAWVVSELPPPVLPDAEKYQVLDWLDDYGITSANVEAALDSIPDETQRRKAKIRWASINRVPADNAFVVHVAKQLNIDIKTAWSQILAK